MIHPFKEKQAVKCVKAPGSLNLEEGESYIVESPFFFSDPDPEIENKPGITVFGRHGYFMADMFIAQDLKI